MRFLQVERLRRGKRTNERLLAHVLASKKRARLQARLLDTTWVGNDLEVDLPGTFTTIPAQEEQCAVV